MLKLHNFFLKLVIFSLGFSIFVLAGDDDDIRQEESLKLLHLLQSQSSSSSFSNDAAVVPCPNGWEYKSLTSSCYIVPNVYLPWNSAKDYCNNVTGGTLISILSQNEYDLMIAFALNYSPLYPIWLGLYRDPSIISYDSFKWLDNDYRYNLTKWLPKEPSNSKECFAWKTSSSSSINSSSGYKSLSCKYSQPFICKQHSASCESTIFQGMKGNLSSPNYPYNYDNNLDCYYHISVPDGYIVNLTVLDFATEGEYNFFDYVDIFDGPDDNAYSLQKLGGTKVPIGSYYETTQRYMTLRFHTDYSLVRSGWLFNFVAGTTNPVTYFNTSMGIISSPNYPNNYTNYLIQFYKIVVPTTKIVLVEIKDFVTQASSDYLRIIDGDNATDVSQTMAMLSGNLTGNGSLPLTFDSKQSIVSLVFYTDREKTFSGWTLNFRTAPKL